MLVWRGTSRLDGVTPIVALATYADGRGKDSANVKTGAMTQIWILRDDMHPYEAFKLGLDGAICGDCKHSSSGNGGSESCYVAIWRAPAAIWSAFKRDGTRTDKHGNPTTRGDSLPFDPQAFAGRKVRFGSYGDPAAVPLHVWASIAEISRATTGYTHQWKTCDPGYSAYLMASVDSEDEHRQALALGYRTFWVRPVGSPKPQGIAQCPAAVEAGKKTTCSTCLKCSGTASGRTGSVTIQAHGSTRTRFSLPISPVVPAASRKCSKQALTV